VHLVSLSRPTPAGQLITRLPLLPRYVNGVGHVTPEGFETDASFVPSGLARRFRVRVKAGETRPSLLSRDDVTLALAHFDRLP
jgi:hypothetical protein